MRPPSKLEAKPARLVAQLPPVSSLLLLPTPQACSTPHPHPEMRFFSLAP